MNDYVAAVLFFLPAGLSNLIPVLANHVPGLQRWTTPLDFGKTWRGRRLLGDNKTWRGLVCGTLTGGLTAVIVSRLNANTVVTIAPFWIGCLLGFGALLGDAIESYFKRLRGLHPGASWFPFDQLDFIIGGLLLVYPFVRLPVWAMVTILIAYFLLHLLLSYIGYVLRLKRTPI